jgi:hypothetical protein
MSPIEFIGIRGGHGTTTVALAAAATLAARGPTRLATHDHRALCAIAGIAHDGLPIPLGENLELAVDGHGADVIDAGTLEQHPDQHPDDDQRAERRQSLPVATRIGVLRGPDYLGIRTLCGHPEAALHGLVLLSETGRALEPRDVEHVSGRPVVAVIEHTPVVARVIDAGLLLHRLARLREFTQLRTWITQTASMEEPCAVLS